jgi:hypothetical protein
MKLTNTGTVSIMPLNFPFLYFSENIFCLQRINMSNIYCNLAELMNFNVYLFQLAGYPAIFCTVFGIRPDIKKGWIFRPDIRCIPNFYFFFCFFSSSLGWTVNVFLVLPNKKNTSCEMYLTP